MHHLTRNYCKCLDYKEKGVDILRLFCYNLISKYVGVEHNVGKDVAKIIVCITRSTMWNVGWCI
jgi:hypothetical protein